MFRLYIWRIASLFCAAVTFSPFLAVSARSADGGILEGLRIRNGTYCDGSELSLRCPENTLIDVASAFYGRVQPGNVVCPYLHTLTNVPSDFKESLRCQAESAYRVIQQVCQERRSCHLKVNYKAFGLDPCPLTGKYLTVGYRCMPVVFIRKLACEGRPVELLCERRKRLFVGKAYYGWDVSGPEECQPRSDSADQAADDTDKSGCSSKAAQTEIQKLCSGRRTCLFVASDIVLGRVCPDKIKYLDVSYVCIPESIILSSWRGPNSTAAQAAVTSAVSSLHIHSSQNDRPGDITATFLGSPSAEVGTASKLAEGIALEQLKSAGSAGQGHRVMQTLATGNSPVATEPSLTASIGMWCNETGPHATHRHGSAYGDDDLLMGWVHALKYMQDNTEKMVLYGALCGCLALLLAMMLAIGRLLHVRRRHRGRQRKHLLIDRTGDEDDSDRHKLNASSDAGPLSADHSNEENTYVPAADPSDVAGLTAYGLGLIARSGVSSRSDDVFHRHDLRHTYYENEDSGGGDHTRTNSFYDRHS